MKFEVNVQKKYFFSLLIVGLIVVGLVGVFAYNTNYPSTFGHSVGEIDWNADIPKLCLNGVCMTNWTTGSGGTTYVTSGVSDIVAGSGITATKNSSGVVTIAATGIGGSGSSDWTTSGASITTSKNVLITGSLVANGNVNLGDYVNLGEDIYGADVNAQGTSATDTCPGTDSINSYTCLLSDSLTCKDIYSAGSGFRLRDVTCVVASAGINIDSGYVTFSGVHIKLPGNKPLYQVANGCADTGVLTFNNTCSAKLGIYQGYPRYADCTTGIVGPYNVNPVACPNILV